MKARQAIVACYMWHVWHSLAFECPVGWDKQGSDTTDINDCSGTGCGTFTDVNNIAACGTKCLDTEGCAAFAWIPLENPATDSDTCKLFDQNVVTEATTVTQILCKPLECPVGSPQIGRVNNDFSYDCASASDCEFADESTTIVGCQEACDESEDCRSFSWDAYGNVCTLWPKMVPDSFTTTGNQVICQDTCDIFDTTSKAKLYGDPHFKIWSGYRHHFQGAVAPVDYRSYYLVTACNQNDIINDLMPFSLVGVFKKSSARVSWDVYAVLELYDGDDLWYVWIDYKSVQGWAKVGKGTSRIYTDAINDPSVTMNSLSAGSTTPFADGKFSLYIGTNSYNKLYIYDREEETEPCQVNFRQYGSFVSMDPPSCYECYVCGLLGDFQIAAQDGPTILTCDGERIDFTSRPRRDSYMDSYAFRDDGLTWQTDYVDENCTSASVPSLTQPEFDDTGCSTAVEEQIQDYCQNARRSLATCCANIAEGRTFCAQQQVACEDDACEAYLTAGVDPGERDEAILNTVNEFTDIVNVTCTAEINERNDGGEADPFVPKLLYEFEGDLKETTSGGDSLYTLETSGSVTLENGKLTCAGTGYVKSTNNFDFGIGSHTYELLVQFTTSPGATGGSVMGMKNGAETENEMVSYQRLGNNKPRYGIQTEFFLDGTSEVYQRNTEGSTTVGNTEITHIVVTFDEATPEAALTYYRDGQKKDLVNRDPASSVAAQFVTTTSDDPFELTICHSYDTSQFNSFSGAVLFAAYYETALTESQVSSLYLDKMPASLGDYEDMGNELLPGKSVRFYQSLFSVDENYMLFMRESDATLVLRRHDPFADIETWLSTTGSPCAYLKYATDGSLALYDSSDVVCNAIHAADGQGAGGVVLTDNGILKAYGAAYESTIIFDVEAASSGHSDLFDLDLWHGIMPEDELAGGSMLVYLTWLLTILLVLNVVCLTISCFRNKSAGPGYKVVSIVDSTYVDTDIEAVAMLKK